VVSYRIIGDINFRFKLKYEYYFSKKICALISLVYVGVGDEIFSG